LQTQTHLDFEQQQQYGAMIRSLSRETSAQIRDWQLFHNAAPLESIAPHLNLENLKASWAYPRGVLDGIALRLRHSDAALHASLAPEGMIESLIFEVLEQIRVESNCPEELKGCRKNTQTQFIAWMQQFIASGGVEGSIGLLLVTIFSTVWMKLNSQPIPQLMQDIVEATRAGIAQDMGPLLVKLKASRNNQEAYAQVVHEVISLVSGLIADEYRNNPSIRTKRKNQSATHLKIEWVPPHAGKVAVDFKSPASNSSEQRLTLKKSLEKYHVYNSSYDSESEAKKKIRSAQLAIYQDQLNQEIAKQNIPWAKLIRIYQQIFSSQLPKRWQTTEAEGLLDRRYLIRTATSPLQPALYKQLATTSKVNAKTTLLIDCSGSMKEQRVKIAACVDSLVRILEQAGIKTEVLGYSTSSWQGGRPFKEWRKNGQPPNPGRLNERAHWIFKDFDTNWRRSRAGIAALLRPEIYAESVDGEALIWATERLQNSSGSQRTNNMLILFSDGCPMDRATIEANGEEFLKNHLLQAIAWCEQQSHLQLWGCGIGSELRPAFQHRLSWDEDPNNIASTLKNWASEFKASSFTNKKYL
jgi:cobaltochelatase CobT